MSGGLSGKSCILFVAVVVVSCLVPVASGQGNFTINTTDNTSPSNVFGSDSTTGGGAIPITTTQPPGQEASDTQNQIETDLKNSCSEVTNCTVDNKVEPAYSDYKRVCRLMESFVHCVESNCPSAANTTALQQAKDKYKECSGCALQVSVVIMLLAVIAGRLI